MEEFDDLVQRKGTRSVKWDGMKDVFGREDIIPLWIADMDFKAPLAVNKALAERVEHGIYGYTLMDHDLKSSIAQWVSKHHNWSIKEEWISFSPSVIASLNAAIEEFTNEGDKVLIQTPVYTPFYDIINNHKREVIRNPLLYENQYYSIDFKDFEEKLQSGVKALVFCSPHNPSGRVWKTEEIDEIGRLCLKYDVFIISDEIHCDLVHSGSKHIPIASISDELSEITLTLMSPTKTFNLAGLQASFMVAENNWILNKMDQRMKRNGISSLNTMGNIAMEAAFNYGDEWLKDLMSYVEENKKMAVNLLETKATVLKTVHSEGTYLLWLDMSGLNKTNEELQELMLHQAKVGLNNGIAYGEESSMFMRINLACPKETLNKGLNQIIDAVQRLS